MEKKYNGCGIFGLWSKGYKLIKGEYPPYHEDCKIHDEIYANAETYDDCIEGDLGLWASCYNRGCKKTAWFFWYVLKYFGWIGYLKGRFTRVLRRM